MTHDAETVEEVAKMIEPILFRRVIHERLAGYTIETATEIAAALSAIPQPSVKDAAKVIADDPDFIFDLGRRLAKQSKRWDQVWASEWVRIEIRAISEGE